MGWGGGSVTGKKKKKRMKRVLTFSYAHVFERFLIETRGDRRRAVDCLMLYYVSPACMRAGGYL